MAVKTQIKIQGQSEARDIRDKQLYDLGQEKMGGLCIHAGDVVTFDGEGNMIAVDPEEYTQLDEHLYNAKEKSTAITDGATMTAIDLANGPIQTVYAKTITMPDVVEGYTLLLRATVTSPDPITWKGATIKWPYGIAPVIGIGDNVFSFIGVKSTFKGSVTAWLGTYVGLYS